MSIFDSVKVEVIVTPRGSTTPIVVEAQDPAPNSPDLHFESRVPEYAELVSRALKGLMPTAPRLNEVNDDGYLRAIATMAAAAVRVANGGGAVYSETYEPMFGGEFTVTTATDEDHPHPWARSSVSGRLDKRYRYRVTFDGEQYILPGQLFDYVLPGDALYIRVFEYAGNASLYRLSDAGLLNEPFDVPFLIVSADDENGAPIDVYTKDAGTHTVLVEQIVVDSDKILNDLVYGDAYVPFQWRSTGSVFVPFSVGANRVTSATRMAFALGYANTLSGSCAFATGEGNNISGGLAAAFGGKNTVAAAAAFAEGFGNTVSEDCSHAEGVSNNMSGKRSHVEGQLNIVTGSLSHVEGDANRSYALGAHVEGGGNVVDSTQLFTHVGGINNATSNASGKTVVVTKYDKDGNVIGTTTRALGKYAEVIGNGDSDAARSNARTLDWNGNEELAGGLTLGLGTADETTITAAQLKALLALLNE